MKVKRWSAFLTALVMVAVLGISISTQAITAKGVILIERETGRILFEQDAHQRLPMASTTKIMTALITLEQPNLDDYFEVDARAIQVEGSSMGLQEGDQVTLRVLAYGMLLASGNDAANAAAVRIAGSEAAFVKRMNDRAQEMGLYDTHFSTPSGLDGEAHYSTAYDMALLARYALENPDFAEICGSYQAKVSYGNPPYERWLKNHNKLLDTYEGTIGVKTGFTEKAGRCLVSAAQRDEVGLICVTLGASDDWNVHKTLYDQFFNSIQERELDASLPRETIRVVGADEDEVSIGMGEVPVAALTEEELEKIQRRIELSPFLYAPVQEGQVIGKAIYTLEEKEVCRVPLVAGEDAVAVKPKPKGFFATILGWLAGKK